MERRKTDWGILDIGAESSAQEQGCEIMFSDAKTPLYLGSTNFT